MHRSKLHAPLLYIAALQCCFLLCGAAEGSTFVKLRFNFYQTEQATDSVVLELFDDRPLSRDNFLAYVDGEKYDGTIMHRLVKGFVLQGGGFYEDYVNLPEPLNIAIDPDPVDLDGNPSTANPTLMNEFDNSPTRSNTRGTIAMAKLGGDPNSATNQFFFNLGNNAANLDGQNGGFTVFAQVAGDGMTLIDSLATMSVTNLNNDFYTENSVHQVTAIEPDGTRDYNGAYKDVPNLSGQLLRLEEAKRIQYFPTGANTNVPSSGLLIGSVDGLIEQGALFTGSGRINIAGGATLEAEHGASIGRPINNYGTFAPGVQLGAVAVSAYEQFSLATLDVQLRGTTAGTDYDQLNVSFAAKLDGTLKVSLIDPFFVSSGDAFTVLTAGSIAGDFRELDMPRLRGGLQWDVDVSNTAVTVSVLGILGDYTLDGVVDAADYTLWRDTLDSTTNLVADGNGDGIVGEDDYDIWKLNFGKTATAASVSAAAVPEPTALALAAFGLVGALLRRRTRC